MFLQVLYTYSKFFLDTPSLLLVLFFEKLADNEFVLQWGMWLRMWSSEPRLYVKVVQMLLRFSIRFLMWIFWSLSKHAGKRSGASPSPRMYMVFSTISFLSLFLQTISGFLPNPQANCKWCQIYGFQGAHSRAGICLMMIVHGRLRCRTMSADERWEFKGITLNDDPETTR